MAKIIAVASYIPPQFENNLKKLDKFDIDSDFILNKLGVRKVSRKLESDDTSDMCVKAFYELPIETRSEKIDCIAVCTQNPDGHGIPHVSAIVHGKLGFGTDCACFDISLGCSGYIYSLSILQSFMENNGFSRGLLFTADPYSKIVDPDDKNTALLFGDAATVTVIKLDNNIEENGYLLKKFIFQTKGSDRNALHNHNGILSMNGRAILNFALTDIPSQIDKLLKSAGLEKSEIDSFLFHQGSKFIIDNLHKKMGLSPNQVPINLEEYGNTVSSSIPLLLESIISRKEKRIIVMTGFGVGLSWASCLAIRN